MNTLNGGISVLKHFLAAYDSHTAGQPTRVVVGGLPALTGTSLSAMRDDLKENHDWVRTLVLGEPRSSRHNFGAALVPSPDPACDRGIIFFSVDGYPDMCGHATIGAATTLVALGLVNSRGDLAELTLDTPGGIIGLTICLREGQVESVAFRNHPSYYLATVRIPGPSRRSVPVDIACGGQWFAFLDARKWGLAVELDCLSDLLLSADIVRDRLNQVRLPPDPRTGLPPAPGNVVWVDEPRNAGSTARNVAISPRGVFDRAPCATATAARMAVLYAKDRLAPGAEFVNESITDTRYVGRVVAVTPVGNLTAIIPEIRGRAWLTGSCRLWVDPSDPIGCGRFIPA